MAGHVDAGQLAGRSCLEASRAVRLLLLLDGESQIASGNNLNHPVEANILNHGFHGEAPLLVLVVVRSVAW